MTIAVFAIIGAFCYRLRGGAASLIYPGCGTQFARMCWCLPTAVFVTILTVNAYAGLAAFPLLFAGLMIPHGVYQNGDIKGLFGMGAVTLARVGLVVVAVYGIDGSIWWPALITASFAGAAYWIAHRIPSTIPQLERGCALGEAFTGALIWAGFTISALGV